jgi:predicted Ser/Thr protein kinase
MPTAVAAPPTELVLGRYRPLRPLGSGGSGSVWLARDEATGLDVAVKVVRREGKADPRAEREARVSARLRHERCLRAYSFGRDDEHAYIAYEYVAGHTLREAMRAGTLDDRTAIEAAAQVLEGLAYAHARGVVHRDVKPANVLLAEGNGVSVRILDFGLASVAEAETLTATGDVPGTLAYIAPERLGGAPAGPPADVWGVGVLLWEALAGLHPFWQSSPLATARAIEAGAPPLLTKRPDLPRPLLAAVDSALALDPRRRPRPGQLALALRRAVAARERRSSSAPRRPLALPRLPSLPRAPGSGAALAAVSAAAITGWCASALPFYPPGWALGLALLAGVTTLVRPRVGVALALAAPILPLGNFSLGVAVLYAAVAAAWLAFSWREPRSGLLFAAGPFLAPLGALGLLPLVSSTLRSPVRRAVVTALAVLTAALVAGLRRAPLPFTGDAPPLGLGLAGSDRPLVAGSALWSALAERPYLLGEAVALAAAAALLPLVRGRGPWWVAAFGAAFLAATLVPAPGVVALPLVLAVWATCAVLALSDAS